MIYPDAIITGPSWGDVIAIGDGIVAQNGYEKWCRVTWCPKGQYWISQIYNRTEKACPHPSHNK